MNQSPEESPNQTQARALLEDIRCAPSTNFPRRDTIMEWLSACVIRAKRKGYVTADADARDLIALDQFLRTYAVPAASDSAA